MFAQEGGDLKERQSEDGIVAAANAGEKMHADGFNLVASRAPQRGLAKTRQICIHLGLAERAHRQLIDSQMMPDPRPVTHDHRRRVEPVGLSLESQQLPRGGGMIIRLAKHLTINLENLVGGEEQLPGDGSQS